MTTLDNWFCTHVGTWMVSPFENRVRLQGVVYGHPRKLDGDTVLTSRVISVSGDKAITRSGTVYVLGQMHPDYRKLLKKNGIVL